MKIKNVVKNLCFEIIIVIRQVCGNVVQLSGTVINNYSTGVPCNDAPGVQIGIVGQIFPEQNW